MSATLVSGKLRLTYFGVRGSCDKVRLIMAQAGIEYQEEVVKGRGRATSPTQPPDTHYFGRVCKTEARV